jgi:hypothetical protein
MGSISGYLEELYEIYDVEETACRQAQKRIDNGGPVARFIGSWRHRIHATALAKVVEEVEVIELHVALSGPTASDSGYAISQSELSQ